MEKSTFSSAMDKYLAACAEAKDDNDTSMALVECFQSMFPNRMPADELCDLADFTVANRDNDEGWDGVTFG